jgi:hypothetical protein
LALALSQLRRPVIIVDPCAQYRAYPLYESAEDAFQDAGVNVFRAGFESDPEENFSRVMAELDGGVWNYADYTLIVDEASFLQRPQAMHADLARLIRQAPDDITVIQTLHRPSETHTTVRALATDAFFFQMYLPRDLDCVSEAYGSDVAEAVRHLGPHQVLHWWLGPAGNPTWCVWNDPQIWYVPIGGTMPNEENNGAEPTELEEPPAGDEAEAEEPEEPAEVPAAIAGTPDAEGDEVRKQLKAARSELDKVRKENAELRRMKPQQKPTGTPKPAQSAPVEAPTTTDKSVLEWLLS